MLCKAATVLLTAALLALCAHQVFGYTNSQVTSCLDSQVKNPALTTCAQEKLVANAGAPAQQEENFKQCIKTSNSLVSQADIKTFLNCLHKKQ